MDCSRGRAVKCAVGDSHGEGSRAEKDYAIAPTSVHKQDREVLFWQ